MSNSRPNTDQISFIPHHQGIPNNTQHGNGHVPTVVGGIIQSQNQFQPTITTFAKKFNHFVFNGYGTGLVEIARFNLFKHSQNFNSAHINFKLEAVLSHPLVKGLGYKVYGGVCIDSSNPSILLFDKFKLEASTPHITQFGSSDLVSVLSSATWINLDLDTSNVAHGSYDEGEEGSPNCVLIITANIPNTSGATLNNILVRGMITLL